MLQASYCSLFDVCWSFGVVGVEWYPCCRLQPGLLFFKYSSTITMMHGPINIIINTYVSLMYELKKIGKC